jgi:hypothetical protein
MNDPEIDCGVIVGYQNHLVCSESKLELENPQVLSEKNPNVHLPATTPRRAMQLNKNAPPSGTPRLSRNIFGKGARNHQEIFML